MTDTEMTDIPRKPDGSPDWIALLDECDLAEKRGDWPWERIYAAGRQDALEEAAKMVESLTWGDTDWDAHQCTTRIAFRIRKLLASAPPKSGGNHGEGNA